MNIDNLNSRFAFWIFQGDRIEKVSAIVAFLVTLFIALGLITLTYWIAGGPFERGSSLAIYAMFSMYIVCVTANVAHSKYKEDVKQKHEDEEFKSIVGQ